MGGGCAFAWLLSGRVRLPPRDHGPVVGARPLRRSWALWRNHGARRRPEGLLGSGPPRPNESPGGMPGHHDPRPGHEARRSGTKSGREVARHWLALRPG